MLARVLPASQAPPIRGNLVQYALGFTAVHVALPFAERNLPVTAFEDIYRSVATPRAEA
jgi:hypothetical protein